MSISSSLFPPANREAAAVAFLRTFWQVIRATSYLGGGGIIVVTATQLAHINLQLLGLVVGAILASGVLSGLLAAGNILANGLPDAYTNAAAALSSSTVTNVYNPPVPAPVDPSQPAAGTPPAFDTLVNPAIIPVTAPPVVPAPVVAGDTILPPTVTA